MNGVSVSLIYMQLRFLKERRNMGVRSSKGGQNKI